MVTDISRSRRIAAGPDAVWELLADFGSLSTWADGIDHSCLLNGDRHPEFCGLARRIQSGRRTFVETIVTFEPPRSLAYEITGVPRGLTVSNRWDVAGGRDDSTTVTVTSSVAAASRALPSVTERAFGLLMARQSDTLLASLAARLEGTP